MEPDITIQRISDNAWILHLTHESHDKSSDSFLLVPNMYTFDWLYRVVAFLQYKHNEGEYKTEDLSGKQVAFVLNKLLNLDIVSLDTIKNLPEGWNVHCLDLFWNWEQCVVKFCFDEHSRRQGEKLHFYPDVNFSDYELNGTATAFLAMDRYFQ
ncbi:TPA: hypothetical protein L7J68_004245 [Klebsiella pneumoniae]|nr:hypothetical protein [Klebsiella pneumoniae]HBQ1190289.1 hypothetical protein [Klebsiella pneumoniae]HBV8197811.1 hypothetical protein [Escherichia coli]